MTRNGPHPRLSVVLPVRNEEAHLPRVLDDLLGQSLETSAYELLVVDGMSDDGTRDLVERYATTHGNIRLLDNPGRLSGRARNVGAAAAAAPYVLFVDGHCRILSDTMLADVLAAFESGARCVSRPQPLMPEHDQPFQQAVSLARSTPLGHYAGSRIYSDEDGLCSPLSAGCGYERKLYEELGGVDESFDAAEDLEFNLRVERAGVKARHSEAFAVGYVPRSSWRALFRQIYRYGYGRARTARKHPGTFSPLVGMLSLMIVVMAVLTVAASFHPAFAVLWASLILAYGSAVGLSALWGARNAPGLWFSVASALAAVHLGGGLGYLMGLLGGPSLSQAPDGQAGRTPSGVL